MKKLFLIGLVFIFTSTTAQHIPGELTEQLADETGKALKKSKIPADMKLAILYFTYNNGFTDTTKTPLGRDLSKQFEQKLSLYLQKKRLSYKLLTSNKIAEKNMMKFFVPPDDSKEEAKFWEEFLGNQRPDYFITGTYKIGKNYNTLKTVHVKILPNKYVKNLVNAQSLTIPGQVVETPSVKDKLHVMKYEKPHNISEFSKWLSFMMKFQFSNTQDMINLMNFTYQDTRMASQFSKKLTNILEQKLSANAGYKITTKQYLPFVDDKPFKYTISGTYWEEGNNLKMVTVLKDARNQKTIASAENTIPKFVLEKNAVAYKPDNFEKALKDQRIFKTDEIVPSDLNVEIWANKGNENLIYTENDTLALYVRANNKCYLRLIYYLADGSKVLMMDNYYVSPEKVNKIIKLPDEFVCAEPFGAETMVLNAQSEPFVPLMTKEQYGYTFILDDTKQVVMNTRGFKKLNTGKELQKAEQRLLFTTMKD